MKWKKRHPEAYKQSEKERRERYIIKDPLRNMLKRVKGRAKKSGLEFRITKANFPGGVPSICPALGTELSVNSKKGHWPHSPSIDRIDNSKGYIPGNVKIISWRANSLKSDATIDEVEKILAYMKKEYVPSVGS